MHHERALLKAIDHALEARALYDAVPAARERRRMRVPAPEWEAVQTATRDLCTAMRDAGETPEHTVVRFKDVLQDARSRASIDAHLRAALVTECIKAYFDGA